MTVSLTVLAPFYDLRAHKQRAEGETFEATEGRAAELAAVLPGYVEVAEAAKTHKGAANAAKNEVVLSKMTVAQLRALASERGLDIPKGSKKADIIALLEE